MFTRLICSLFCAFAINASAESELPDINFTTIQGDPIHLDDTQGTLRVINFWATWCPPCVKEMPALARLDAELRPHEGQVIAINVGEDAVSVEAFLLETLDENQMAIWLDTEGLSFTKFKLAALPMTLIVDQQGQVVERVMGIREWDSAETIAALLKLTPQ